MYCIDSLNFSEKQLNINRKFEGSFLIYFLFHASIMQKYIDYI